MNKYSSNRLHAHSDAYYSGMGDGAQTIFEYVQAALEQGATAIALTDHGNCANLVDFYLYCKGNDVDHKRLPEGTTIKPILGVEAYITTEGFYDGIGLDALSGTEIKQHAVILCKDYEGFQAMSRFVSECNRNLDDKRRPVGTEEMLRTYFGPGSPGYGHVICSSACMGGILATPLSYNDKLQKQIDKIERRIQASVSRIPTEFFDAEERIKTVNEQIDSLKAQIDDLTPVATKSYRSAKSIIKKEPDPAIRERLQEELDLEIFETNQAKTDIAELKAEIKRLRDSLKMDREIYNKHKAKLETITNNQESISLLRSHMKSEEQLIEDTKAVALRYREIFGDDFYGEIQYHGDETEARYFRGVIQVAEELGLELIATNDEHIARPEDIKRRELMRNIGRIGKGSYQPAEQMDKELYYKSGDELAEYLKQVYPEEVVDRAMRNIDVVCEKCNFDLPITKTVKPHKIDRTEDMSNEVYEQLVQKEQERVDAINAQVPNNLHYPEYRDADRHLRELAETGMTHGVTTMDGKVTFDIDFRRGGIQNRYGDKWNESYQERMDYELDVIAKMGYASYFLFIADVICACKGLDGFHIGPGRGSGAGSIVCYLSGITELDPIKYNLLFERFLNPARVSMPKMCRTNRAFNVNVITQRCA